MPVGNRAREALMAACTSRAAPLMSRLRSNCKVTRVLPSDEYEVSSFTPAIVPSARSKGVATVAAMVSGLAPGKLACTEMVGNSTWGKGATGNWKYANTPAKARPKVSKVVATGRATKGAEKWGAPSAQASRTRVMTAPVANAAQKTSKSPAWCTRSATGSRSGRPPWSRPGVGATRCPRHCPASRARR